MPSIPRINSQILKDAASVVKMAMLSLAHVDADRREDVHYDLVAYDAIKDTQDDSELHDIRVRRAGACAAYANRVLYMQPGSDPCQGLPKLPSGRVDWIRCEEATLELLQSPDFQRRCDAYEQRWTEHRAEEARKSREACEEHERKLARERFQRAEKLPDPGRPLNRAELQFLAGCGAGVSHEQAQEIKARAEYLASRLP